MGRKDSLPAIPLTARRLRGRRDACCDRRARGAGRSPQTGRGQYVDIAMLDGVMLLLAQALSAYFTSGRVPTRGSTPMDGVAPHYSRYETKDGKIITIGSIEPWFFANLCRALGSEEFIADQNNKRSGRR